VDIFFYFYVFKSGYIFILLLFCRQLLMREDGKKQVCIVGLQEFEVSDVQIVKEYIEKGNAARSTGTTGANEESSRSHAILQLSVKKHIPVTETRRQRDRDAIEAKNTKHVGKMSFIDLAGSERGADTTDNDKQTRYCFFALDLVFQLIVLVLYDIHFSLCLHALCQN
jgi:kinesin family member 2/24